MCGIAGIITKNKNGVDFLLNSLKKMEYRGYDSAGVAIFQNKKIVIKKKAGKINDLIKTIDQTKFISNVGIAHTRWATHGPATTTNAHPHSSSDEIVIVHNGIIENYLILKEELERSGFVFQSATDTEVIAHLIYQEMRDKKKDLLHAVHEGIKKLTGSFSLLIMAKKEPNCLIACKKGSPLFASINEEGSYVASDIIPLSMISNRFFELKDGCIALIKKDGIKLFDDSLSEQEIKFETINVSFNNVDKGPFAHHMLKEIYEQPKAIKYTLDYNLHDGFDGFVNKIGADLLNKITNIQIIACGTSFHAGLLAKYWFESIAEISCQVEVASEFRYRKKVILENTLLIALSQSGETADTLAAVKDIQHHKNILATMSICNVDYSSLSRIVDIALFTKAGVEIGVASTKTFSAQVVLLMLVVLVFFAKKNNKEKDKKFVLDMIKNMEILVSKIKLIFNQEEEIKEVAKKFINTQSALYIARNITYPIAMEGALKLKEISYIHAEAYPAGELKHGPLALVDKNINVVALTLGKNFGDKVMSNIQEVFTRGGNIWAIVEEGLDIPIEIKNKCFYIPEIDFHLSPLLFNIPLQLLSYHVAILRGTNIDQPRNLAKAVTVE